jgi:hypothetical protein
LAVQSFQRAPNWLKREIRAEWPSLRAAATIASHPIDAVIRALMAIPGILFIWKLIVYDKILGWGSAEDLSSNLWYFAIALPWGFYFLHWTAGRLRS